MKVTVNISPCPNDTFMFEAMLAGRVDTEGLEFGVGFDDIELLNRGVLDGRAQVSKVSYAVFPQVAGRYALLDSGSALGRGNGPLLVARPGVDLRRPGAKLAVPGLHTTANLLIERFFPELTDKTPVLFSEIAAAVESGRFDCGVLIHEGRFTYARHGLVLTADLGRLWEEGSGMPLPLGAIAVDRSLPRETALAIERVLARSVRYALDRPQASADFVRAHAAELSPEVTRAHIGLFVNDFSVSLGRQGRAAASRLLALPEDQIFIDRWTHGQ